MATTVGFQRGARKLAEAAGIRLVKVNRLVRKIIIDFRTQIPIIKNVRLELDADHLAEMGAGNGAGPSALPRILVSPSEYYFLDAAGNRARSLEAILQQDPESTGLVRVSVDGLHVATSVGRVRLRAVVFERTFQEVKEERVVAGGDHVARAILEDLATGGVAYLHEHGTIGGSPDKDECDEFCTRDQHGR
jgi:hypothetical protein